MKKMIMLAGLVAACSASAQLLQNLTQALLEPEPAPAQPVQQSTTTTVQPVPVAAPAPVVVVPPPRPGWQPCPRCGGRGKEEHAMGFKVKRCKLCNGKGFLPPPPPPPVHHHHHRRY